MARLDKFAAQLRHYTGFPVPQTFRQDVTDLLLRFTTLRAQYVATLVKAGLDMSELQLLHPEFKTLGRVYAASLPGFLKSVDDQIATQSAIHSDSTMKEDYCSRAYLCYVRAFICGLQGGAPPMGPNPLDASDPAATTVVVKEGAVGTPTATAQPPSLTPIFAAAVATGQRSGLVSATVRVLVHSAAIGGGRAGPLGSPDSSRRLGVSDCCWVS